MLPLKTNYPPMEALQVSGIPEGGAWQYEPKWDGFRCLAFRDGDSITLQSKSGQPLSRYFPEVVENLRHAKARKFVLDGEIVVPSGRTFSFDDLLQRIHPADSRVQRLARETPALLVVFDLLVDERGRSLADLPLSERRPLLEAFMKRSVKAHSGLHLSPATTERKVAQKWFELVGGTLDGIIAKRLDLPYQSGERTGMVKIKRLRTADCVVGGFRYASNAHVVGSLLLGLYDDGGLLHHVGFSSAFSNAERKTLLRKLKPLIQPPGFTGNAPGAPSRWSTERSTQWEPLKPALVCEVRYDHFSGSRFRHGTTLLRWRPDKAPRQCTFEQVAVEKKAASFLMP